MPFFFQDVIVVSRSDPKFNVAIPPVKRRGTCNYSVVNNQLSFFHGRCRPKDGELLGLKGA